MAASGIFFSDLKLEYGKAKALTIDRSLISALFNYVLKL